MVKKNQIRFVFIAASFFLFLCCRGEIELFCRCFNCALMVDSFLYWTLTVAFSFIFLYFFQSLLIGLLFTRKTRRPPIEKEDIWLIMDFFLLSFSFCNLVCSSSSSSYKRNFLYFFCSSAFLLLVLFHFFLLLYGRAVMELFNRN